VKNKETMKTWRTAVARVWVHNNQLIKQVKREGKWLTGARKRPPEEDDRLSVLLNCERNSGSGRIEMLISAAKELGRGNLPVRTVDYWLNAKSLALLDEIKAIAMALPKSMWAEARALLHAVEEAKNVENRFANFLADRSGCGKEITMVEWFVRLDKLVRDLKKAFEKLRLAIIDIEVIRERQAAERKATRAKFRRRQDKDVDCAKEKDVAAIRKEVRRRVRYRKNKGFATNLRKELEVMYKDFSWTKRCQQWPFETLYTYIIRK